MPKYRVDVTYDMGMSGGGETHQFEADNVHEAEKYLRELEDSDLSPIKRRVNVQWNTFSQVVERS